MTKPMWTANIVKQMHLHSITRDDLGKAMGITGNYVSMILNGEREPAGMRERMESTIKQLIDERSKSC